jgi:hypothetical protein
MQVHRHSHNSNNSSPQLIAGAPPKRPATHGARFLGWLWGINARVVSLACAHLQLNIVKTVSCDRRFSAAFRDRRIAGRNPAAKWHGG